MRRDEQPSRRRGADLRAPERPAGDVDAKAGPLRDGLVQRSLNVAVSQRRGRPNHEVGRAHEARPELACHLRVRDLHDEVRLEAREIGQVAAVLVVAHQLRLVHALGASIPHERHLQARRVALDDGIDQVLAELAESHDAHAARRAVGGHGSCVD